MGVQNNREDINRCHIKYFIKNCKNYYNNIFEYFYFNASHIQNQIKKKISTTVLKYEDDLLAVIDECKNNEGYVIFCCDSVQDSEFIFYKDLNSEKVDKIFKIFGLAYIDCYKDNIITFSILPTITSVLWDHYAYGFYYTKEDRPVDVFWSFEECNEEMEGVVPGSGEYSYRTEKISENWYFYESKIKYYPIKR